MKKIILLFLLIIPINAFALTENAKSSILMDYDTGKILYEMEKDKELAPASMTKMMSLLLIMEKIDDGTLKLTDKVYISENAAKMGGSQAYLESNTYMDLESLLKSIAIASCNDAVVAVAEHISGSVQEFVKLMNEKASILNLRHTSFKNPHGLDEDGHYSSAYDLALIARELIKHEKILSYSNIYEDYITHQNGVKTWIVNTNKLINYYEGLDGLKTGYTSNALYGITATAKRNNMRLISVVMGEKSNEFRNKETIELLNYGFANYKIDNILNLDSNIGNIKIELGNKEKAKLILSKNVVNLVSINEKNNYDYIIKKYKLKAPISKKDVVGKLYLYSNNVKIEEYDLFLKEDIKKANFFKLLYFNIKYLLLGKS